MPELTVSDGTRLVFDVVGNGEPLLLLPGTGQGARLWALQVPAYRQRYLTIVLDTRGAGRSDVPDSGYTTRRMAADAAEVLRSLGITRAHISGQSMGSAVAQELALAEPDLVATLQLHSTWDRPYPHMVRQLRLRQELARRDLWDLFAMNSVLSLFTPEFANAHPEVLIEREQQLFANPPQARGLVGHYDADLAHDSQGRLGQITAPTLVTYGTLDLATLPAYNQKVYEQLPNAELHVFEGAGHLPFSEFPEEFNALTLDFLGRHPMAHAGGETDGARSVRGSREDAKR